MNAPGPSAVLGHLCTRTAAAVADPALRAELEAVAARLTRPLQLVVAGSVSAGKSTLVNAVLGREIAPVDAGECTRIVTWYEYGDGPPLVERIDGSVHELPLEEGRIPELDAAEAADVVRLRVRLPEPLLRTVTLIDTPGVNTVGVGSEASTRRLLFGDDAADAQALLYVLRFVQRFDADTLTEFRTLSAACGLASVNTAAVLTQIDRRADGDDPWPTARALTDSAATQLRGVTMDVVPVVGLLAETARAHRLSPDDRALLRSLDPADLDDLLLDLADLADEGPGHARLVRLLHRYGIRRAVEHLRAGTELDTALARDAGYAGVAAVLDRFARHADELKAMAALPRVRALTSTAAGDAALLAELDERIDASRPISAGLSSLRVLSAAAALDAGELRLPDALADELRHLARGADPRTLVGEAESPEHLAALLGRAAARWRAAAVGAGSSRASRRLHGVVQAWEELAAPRPESPQRVALRSLAESDLLAAPERAALRALAEGSAAVETAAREAGLPVPEWSAEVAARLRARANRPLPVRDRRAVREACALFESLTAAHREHAR